MFAITRTLSWLLVISWVHSACIQNDKIPIDYPVDKDDDGFVAEVDCDDQNSNIWQLLSFTYRDQDGDGYTIDQGGTLCAGGYLPATYSNTSKGRDCNDFDSKAWLNHTVFLDLDGDGSGFGDQISVCGGNELPEGYALVGEDCLPNDSTRWKMLKYAFLDEDNDGYTVPATGRICSGEQLAPPYFNTEHGHDCDDDNSDLFQLVAAYADADGDGFGYEETNDICIGNIVPEGFSLNNTDCDDSNYDIWQELSHEFRDQDLDGYTIHLPGTACSGDTLPIGYTNNQNGDDCEDTDPVVWRSVELYPDIDFDGIGNGDSLDVCIGDEVPEGYAQDSTDCAPDDNSKWQNLEYSYRDADGDAHTIQEEGTVCCGTDLPTGYHLIPQNNDCDDQDASIFRSIVAYLDGDGDGHGSGEEELLCIGNDIPSGYSANDIDCDDGNPNIFIELEGYFDEDGDQIGYGIGETFCTDGDLPAMYSRYSSDCAPKDVERWQIIVHDHVDMDFDGYSTPQRGTRCSGGSLDEGYYVNAQSEIYDCSDDDATLFRFRPLFVDQDGDGVGTLPYHIECIGNEVPEGFSIYGDDIDDDNPDIQFPDYDEEFQIIVFG